MPTAEVKEALASLIQSGDTLDFVDMTQRWHNRVPTWPYFPSSEIRNFHSHHKDGLCSLIIETNMHSGTHIDAPLHFNVGGWDLADMPLDRCQGSALVVDLSHEVEEWTYINREMIERNIPEGKALRENDILIIYFNWKRFNWEGPERNEQTFFCKHPGPDPSVTDWLIEKRVKWVASDAPAFEHPWNLMIKNYRPDLVREWEQKTGLKVDDVHLEDHYLHCHRRMMKENLMHVDNVGGDVDKVVGKRIYVMAFPWRFVGGEACICRLVGWVGD